MAHAQPTPDGVAVMYFPLPRGREYGWPAPWPLMSPAVDWTFDCRPHRPPHPDQAKAAAPHLIEMLNRGGYWYLPQVEQELAAINISVTAARHLFRNTPNATSPEPGVWCERSAAGDWPAFKAKVFEVLKTDAVLTFDQVAAALPTDHQSSIYAALLMLVEQHRAAFLQDPDDDEPRFCRARPGHNASYQDLREARTPQAAA